MNAPQNPIEWLERKIRYSQSREEVRNLAIQLLFMVDNDQVQDVFQTEMDRDGYFDDDYEEQYQEQEQEMTEPLRCECGETLRGWDMAINFREEVAKGRANQ